MNRREFLTWVGVGGVASSLPVALAACSPKTTESASPTNSLRADGFQSVGSVAELDKEGQLLNKQFSGGTVLIIREPADAEKIIAVNPTCTHAGCAVAWDNDQKSFICPCHDSKFASNGQATQGPAKEPLATYEAKLDGDAILVKAS